jgi:hypothetical protein
VDKRPQRTVEKKTGFLHGAAGLRADASNHIVALGDYVDRGMCPPQVLTGVFGLAGGARAGGRDWMTPDNRTRAILRDFRRPCYYINNKI